MSADSRSGWRAQAAITVSLRRRKAPERPRPAQHPATPIAAIAAVRTTMPRATGLQGMGRDKVVFPVACSRRTSSAPTARCLRSSLLVIQRAEACWLRAEQDAGTVTSRARLGLDAITHGTQSALDYHSGAFKQRAAADVGNFPVPSDRLAGDDSGLAAAVLEYAVADRQGIEGGRCAPRRWACCPASRRCCGRCSVRCARRPLFRPGAKMPSWLFSISTLIRGKVPAFRPDRCSVAIEVARSRKGQIADANIVARYDEDRLALADAVGDPRCLATALYDQVIASPHGAVVVGPGKDADRIARLRYRRRLTGQTEGVVAISTNDRTSAWPGVCIAPEAQTMSRMANCRRQRPLPMERPGHFGKVASTTGAAAPPLDGSRWPRPSISLGTTGRTTELR